MHYAKIDSTSKVVTDLLKADRAPAESPGFEFVEYSDKKPAWIGLRWSSAHGFEQPAPVEQMATDFHPAMADPSITAAEFEAALRKYEKEHPRG